MVGNMVPLVTFIKKAFGGGHDDDDGGRTPDPDSAPDHPQLMDGDDQDTTQNGTNHTDLTEGGDVDTTGETDGTGGSGDTRAGRNASTTTISPVVSPVTHATSRGQSQASSSANANQSVQGQQHQQVQASYDVTAPQQNIAVPVTVDMTKTASASTTTTSSTAIAVAALLAGTAVVFFVRPKSNGSGRTPAKKRRLGRRGR